MPVVSPPQIIGVRDVAAMFGVAPDRIRRRVKQRHEPTMYGYLGKISNRHCWNAQELIRHVFTSDVELNAVVASLTSRGSEPEVLCGACNEPAVFAGLCRQHLRRFMLSWQHAERSSLVLLQLVGMCRWIVDRHEHLVLPADFDPFGTTCMTPGCDNRTNIHGGDSWHSPLCPACSAQFWNNPPLRPRPSWWKRPKRKAA